jgi:2-dehydro-3-deoxygluconokinase
MTYDVVTMGETMLRFSPPQMQRFEQASIFESHIGGSESNVAVGLSRLGLNVAWLSRLTNNPLGHVITNGLRSYGVDVSHVTWTDNDRVGLYFYEAGVPPRGGQVIYDRAGSAMSKMQPDDLPRSLFAPQQARVLHVSGITLAIGASAAATTLQAAQWARDAGWLLSFDVNYRGLLWSPEAATAGCHALAELADLLFLPLRDAVSLYGAPNEARAAHRHLKQRYPQARVILTLGAEGAVCDDNADVLYHQAAFPSHELGRLGRGDAFVAGFLYGWLKTQNEKMALTWGTAAAAYKSSIAGDLPLLSETEVSQLMTREQGSTLIR